MLTVFYVNFGDFTILLRELTLINIEIIVFSLIIGRVLRVMWLQRIIALCFTSTVNPSLDSGKITIKLIYGGKCSYGWVEHLVWNSQESHICGTRSSCAKVRAVEKFYFFNSCMTMSCRVSIIWSFGTRNRFPGLFFHLKASLTNFQWCGSITQLKIGVKRYITYSTGSEEWGGPAYSSR